MSYNYEKIISQDTSYTFIKKENYRLMTALRMRSCVRCSHIRPIHLLQLTIIRSTLFIIFFHLTGNKKQVTNIMKRERERRTKQHCSKSKKKKFYCLPFVSRVELVEAGRPINNLNTEGKCRRC